jgi:hypothetical protein
MALLVSVVFLIAIGSPIRFSGRAAYRGNGHNTEFCARVYYLHPVVFSAAYSSADERTRVVILGFKMGQGESGADTINNRDINTETAQADDSAGAEKTDAMEAQVYETDIDTNSAQFGDTDTEKTEKADTYKSNGQKKKRRPFLPRLTDAINGIKRRRAYKIIRNKPLRKKLLRWLKRTVGCALRTVSFEKFKLHARVGMRDPAALGKMYGYFSAAQSALALGDYNINLSMEPVFMEKSLEIDSETASKTTLAAVLQLLTVIAATFPYWQTYKAIRKPKSKDKK